MVEFDALVHHAVDLSGAHGRRPRIMYVGTAIGDAEHFTARMTEAARVAGFDLTPLHLFPMPNVEDVQGAVLEQDVVWVMGGSVANLLAVWRTHGLNDVLRECWEQGVVLGGVSAGSICWYVGGPTDSFGRELRSSPPGLGFLPYGNGVHYDSEEQRRPLLHRLVGEQALPTSHATDDGVGIVYDGTEIAEVVADRPDVAAYVVERQPDGSVTETRLEARVLRAAADG